MKKLNELITGVDNATLDVGRVVLLAGVGAYIYFSYLSISRGAVFNGNDFGIGFGAICAGAGALLKFKEGSEPNGTK